MARVFVYRSPKPALIGVGVIIFVQQWEMVFWPLTVADASELRTIQVAPPLLRAQYQTFWDRLFAAVVLSLILPIAIILPLQRYYISGVSTTGV